MATERLAVKRYGNGKYTLLVDCPDGREKVVTSALLDCADLQVVFNRKAFRSLLSAQGLSYDEVRIVDDNLRVDDETYGSVDWPK